MRKAVVLGGDGPEEGAPSVVVVASRIKNGSDVVSHVAIVNGERREGNHGRNKGRKRAGDVGGECRQSDAVGGGELVVEERADVVLPAVPAIRSSETKLKSGERCRTIQIVWDRLGVS